MDKLGCGSITRSVLRKDKKKKTNSEIDRVKQAEKKKRRLEKALATSAAIRSELEKKKQKKIEEQRLDEEGAAIAESVALLVLGGEDSDCHDHAVLGGGFKGINLLDDTVTAAVPGDYPCLKIYSFNGFGTFASGYRSELKCNSPGNEQQLTAEMKGMLPQIPYITETGQTSGVLSGASSGRSTSVFEFREDSRTGAHYLLNRMMSSSYWGDEVFTGNTDNCF